MWCICRKLDPYNVINKLLFRDESNKCCTFVRNLKTDCAIEKWLVYC